MSIPIPPWATHIAVDANGPVWVDGGSLPAYGHWAPADDYDGLRFDLIGEERIDDDAPYIDEAARLLCVRVPRPEGWEPPPPEDE